MSNLRVDTIAAVATSAGRSAISMIRVSGPEAFKILKKIFKAGERKLSPCLILPILALLSNLKPD
jgi:tRNA modification GTPase